MKFIACVYDKVSQTYENPMTFDNETLPYAQCRRQMRDLFLEGKVSYDQMKDKQLRVVAMFDPDDGFFTNFGDEVQEYEFSEMVADLEACKDEVCY